MTKYLLAALALVAALLGGWGAYGHYRAIKLKADIASQQTTIQNQNTAILAHQAKAKRDTAVLKDIAARNAELLTKQKESSNALSKAIKAAPEWADAPVPPAVSDWLRTAPTVDGTGAGPTTSALVP